MRGAGIWPANSIEGVPGTLLGALRLRRSPRFLDALHFYRNGRINAELRAREESDQLAADVALQAFHPSEDRPAGRELADELIADA